MTAYCTGSQKVSADDRCPTCRQEFVPTSSGKIPTHAAGEIVDPALAAKLAEEIFLLSDAEYLRRDSARIGSDVAVCEEHHIPLTLHIGRVEEADEDAGEVGEHLACRLCVALDAVYDLEHRILALSHDNHRLRAAIGRHRQRIMSLGHDGKGKHGSEWDRDLWTVLYDFLRTKANCLACGHEEDVHPGDTLLWCSECGGSFPVTTESGLLLDPKAITPTDLKTLVTQEDDEVRCQGCEDAPVGMTVRHDVRCSRHGYTARDDICDCPFCQECGMAFVEDGS